MSEVRHVGVILALVVLALATGAQAKQYSFAVIPSDDPGDPVNPVDAAIGEAQMMLEVTDSGGGNLLFTYSNLGPSASSITDIYIDDADGPLMELLTIHNTPGSVEFSAFPTPADLPRGKNLDPPFVTVLCFSADSDPPAQPLGINPYESLSIEYSLVSGATLASVLGELDDGTVRIGLHVQGYGSAGSESFILVPEPATLSLLTLGGLALLRRRLPVHP
jgi:hypothetical protein